MHHISIVIVNFNSDTLTTNCLKSLERIESEGLKLQIVVVDNGSKQEYVLPTKLKNNLTILRSEANLGFTGGNNMGIHYAIEKHNSDYVLLLNNDTTVHPQFLKHLYTYLNEHSEMGMVCPKIYFSKNQEFHAQSYQDVQKGKVVWYGGGSIDWEHLTAFHRLVDEVDRGQTSLQNSTDFCTGCCVLIKREVLEKVASFDQDYFLYFEDVDLSIRAQQFGYSLGYCDQAIVWHENAGSSSGPGSALHQYYQTRNRLLFFWRYGDWKVRRTVAKVVGSYLVSGSRIEKKASLHFLIRQYGKQPIV